MKTTIDTLIATTGWTGPAGAGFSVNNHPEYCADNLASSLLIHVPLNSLGLSFKKTISPSISLSACSEVVLTLWARLPFSADKPADYKYKISFDGTAWFLLPIVSGFNSISIAVHGFTAANRIEIVPLDNEENWLIISGCYGIAEDLPLDLMTGIKTGIELKIAEIAPSGILLLGAVAGTLNGETATASVDQHIGQGAVLVFGRGTAREEKHQVKEFDGSVMSFTAAFSGIRLLYTHVADTIDLALPVAFGAREIEAFIPGITVWGEASEDAQDFSDIGEEIDTIGLDGAAATRRPGWLQGFHVLIDCEARGAWLLHMLARCVRRFIASSRVWVNGQAVEIIAKPTAAYIEPDESAVMIPKLQYDIAIALREERALRVYNVSSGEAVVTVTPEIGQL
jgi:hypothetical protein